MTRTAKARPELPHEEFARQAAHPKPQYRRQPEEQIDTRELTLRKIHPERDMGFRQYLNRQVCSVYDRVDSWTGQRHVCYHPNAPKVISDAAHIGKAYSGALKRTDVRGMFSLCRHAHRLQEDAMDSFDERFGIDRREIASRQYDAYLAEQERKGR